MLIYSNKILTFITNIKANIKTILSHEVGLKVGRERFYDKKQRTSYPIQVVIYNHKSPLGYFDPQFYELGFHESLMHGSSSQLCSIIRHELAHYLTFIEHGPAIQPHGPEFKAFCQNMNWGGEISRATICLEEIDTKENPENHILRKVQKLMALASSPNLHEAEQAVIKSQQLLMKYNLDVKEIETDEERYILARVLQQKKESAKMRAIAKILATFFVSCIFRKGKDTICLEILGSAIKVEIAQYVAEVLDGDLERLWDKTDLKGALAKNSFFFGVAKGYCSKIEALKQSYNSTMKQELIILEKKLIDAQAMAYRHLASRQSQGSYCPASAALGERAGRELTIHPGLKSSSSFPQTLIDK
jgi:hypothetical protein